MDRCLRPYALPTDVNDRFPSAWKDRVRFTTLQDIHDGARHPVTPIPSTEVKDEDVSVDMRVQTRGKDVQYQFYHRDLPLIVEADSVNAVDIPRPISGSCCIPGALAIDPYIRSLCTGRGMKVSENAVWLLVIAMKQFASTCVGHALQSSVTTDQLQAASVPSSILGKRPPVDASSDPNKRMKPGRCLTAFDFHSLATTMPQGIARSAGGCMSRTVFESSLFSSLNESTGQTSADFDGVKRFITSKLSVFTPAKEKARPPISPTALAAHVSTEQRLSSTQGVQEMEVPLTNMPVIAAPPSVERRVSATPGGLGRGAKDLASLKARTTRPEAARASPIVGAAAGPSRSDTPSQSAAAAADTSDMLTPTSEDRLDALQQSARRGKGFGVKNLATMRARSVTSTSSPENNSTKAAAALVAAEEEVEAGADMGITEVAGDKTAAVEEKSTTADGIQAGNDVEPPNDAKMSE